MSSEKQKQAAANAAAELVFSQCEVPLVIGVGTGSTANCFIECLSEYADNISGAVASSEATAERLKAKGIPVLPLNSVESIPYYIDGADEFDPHLCLIKGGGSALTREKIVAGCAEQFICIVDESKQVDVLGRFPLPVEVIPMACSSMIKQLSLLGGTPVERDGVVTDNGNVIIDVHGLSISDPISIEQRINHIPGVVTNGLFAMRPADVVLCASQTGVTFIQRPTVVD